MLFHLKKLLDFPLPNCFHSVLTDSHPDHFTSGSHLLLSFTTHSVLTGSTMSKNFIILRESTKFHRSLTPTPKVHSPRVAVWYNFLRGPIHQFKYHDALILSQPIHLAATSCYHTNVTVFLRFIFSYNERATKLKLQVHLIMLTPEFTNGNRLRLPYGFSQQQQLRLPDGLS